tara:strand:+ start:486 stop:608 length:123 start_codon:yes stop_codon:yes gene_type:complete
MNELTICLVKKGIPRGLNIKRLGILVNLPPSTYLLRPGIN